METDIHIHAKKKKKKSKSKDIELGDIVSENTFSCEDHPSKKRKKKKRTKESPEEHSTCARNETEDAQDYDCERTHNKHESSEHETKTHKKKKHAKESRDARSAQTDVEIKDAQEIACERTHKKREASKQEKVNKRVSFLEENDSEHRKTKKRKHFDDKDGSEDYPSNEAPAPIKKKHKKRKKQLEDNSNGDASDLDDQSLFITQVPSLISEQSVNSPDGKEKNNLNENLAVHGMSDVEVSLKKTSFSSHKSHHKKHKDKSKKNSETSVAESVPDPEVFAKKSVSSSDKKRDKKLKQKDTVLSNENRSVNTCNDPFSSDAENQNIDASTARKSSKITNKKYKHYEVKSDDIFVVDKLLEMIENLELSDEPQPLDFDPPLLHRKNSVKPLSKQEKENLLAQGVTISTKKWLLKEEAILEKNMLEFMEKERIPHPALLLGFVPQLHRKLLKYVRAKNFYILLGKDLNDRQLHSIYKKARQIFSPFPRIETMTQEDFQQVLNLQARKGYKWAKCAKFLNCDPQMIESTVRWRSSEKTLGDWTEDEDWKLEKAVKKYSKKIEGVDDDKLQQLSWEKVAKKVATRNASQCYRRWVYTLSYRLLEGSTVTWKKHYSACLIYLLHKNLALGEENIDWNNIVEKINKSLNAAMVKKKWRALKYEVPYYKERKFEDIVLYLNNYFLPGFLEGLPWTMDDIRKTCDS